MQITAQKRGLIDKLKENTNIGGIAAEKLFNPEFKRVMESLREADNNIRSIAAGKSIDGGDPGSEEGSLKSLYKEANSNYNRREYMTVVSLLGSFHKKLADMVAIINNLQLDVNQVHEDFLFKDLNEKHMKNLHNLQSRFANRVVRRSLLSNAGIMDFLQNIGTTRGRALAAWGKRYPKQVKKLQRDTKNLLNKTESAMNFVLEELKKMSNHRAARQVDDYVKSAEKIVGIFNKYHGDFANYYKENVKGFLDNQTFPESNSEKSETDNAPKEESAEYRTSPLFPEPLIEVAPYAEQKDMLAEKAPVPEPPPLNKGMVTDRLPESDNTNKATEVSPPVPSSDINLPGLSDLYPEDTPRPASSNPVTTSVVDYDDKAPDTIRSRAHADFYKTLCAMRSESPLILSLMIRKYASSIEKTDKETSKTLNNIANNISEE